MPNTKISDLAAVTTPASTDEFAVNQGGTTKKETRAQVHTLESGETLDTVTGVDLLLQRDGATKITVGSGAVTIADEIIVSGTGPNAIGGATVGWAQLHMPGDFTSDGSSTVLVGMRIDGGLTGAIADTSYLVGTQLVNNIITQIATESIANVAQLRIHEPNIINNLTGGGVITVAATVYIVDAPTEGATNAALYVVAGDTNLSTVTVRSTLDVAGALTATTGTFSGLLQNTGGAKLEIQDAVNGGSSRGIFMWTLVDDRWGIYMGQAGASRSLSDGTAVAGDGFTSHAIRFRISDGPTNGFIWENSAEVRLMSLRGQDGFLSVAGDVTIGGDLTVSGTGPHAIGGPVLDYVQIYLHGNFTGSGGANQTTAVLIGSNITGTVGDTSRLNLFEITGTVTTQGTDTNISLIASAFFREPTITNNLASSGKPDVAATVVIFDAPTEGDLNYALWVDDGDIRSDGVFIQNTVTTLANDGTPTVAASNLFKTGGTTAITDFNGGVVGQTIQILSEHAVTITDGAPIILNGSANFVMAAADTLTLTMFNDQVWQEVSRTVNL